MSKWTIEKIKKQIKFGDFVEVDGDDFNKRVYISLAGDCFFTAYIAGTGLSRWHINNATFKFFDRQGKEILPEPDYKYVNFDSFGELCEAIVNGEAYFLNKDTPVEYDQLYFSNVYHWRDKYFKRVEV